VGVLPHYVVALSVEIAQHGVVVDCHVRGEEGGRVEGQWQRKEKGGGIVGEVKGGGSKEKKGGGGKEEKS
jgi:hypothetical protein